MPAYQNVTPPSSLFSGDVGFSFNNEAFPGSALAGSQFALPSFTGTNDPGTAVPWQTIFGTAPTAVNNLFQGALADVHPPYPKNSTSPAANRGARPLPSPAGPRHGPAKFLRLQV